LGDGELAENLVARRSKLIMRNSLIERKKFGVTIIS